MKTEHDLSIHDSAEEHDEEGGDAASIAKGGSAKAENANRSKETASKHRNMVRHTMFEKLFRWKDRFFINDVQHPRLVLMDIKKSII